MTLPLFSDIFSPISHMCLLSLNAWVDHMLITAWVWEYAHPNNNLSNSSWGNKENEAQLEMSRSDELYNYPVNIQAQFTALFLAVASVALKAVSDLWMLWLEPGPFIWADGHIDF